jgi:DNA-3-methyladenine glycosylase II
MIKTLSNENLPEFCQKLAAADSDLACIFQTYGTPPLWEREATFATLIHIILEQQVSLASARSAFNKLRERLTEITPENVLTLNDAEMKACYFSRQKTVYARDLSKAILDGNLALENLQHLADEEVKTKLKQIKGIGDWTAECYLLMVLLRPDVMPKGDIALHSAYQKLKGLEKRPASDEFIKFAEKWSPYRAVAARLLWHFYLSEREIKAKVKVKSSEAV